MLLDIYNCSFSSLIHGPSLIFYSVSLFISTLLIQGTFLLLQYLFREHFFYFAIMIFFFNSGPISFIFAIMIVFSNSGPISFITELF